MESPEVEERDRGLEVMAGLLYPISSGFALQKSKISKIFKVMQSLYFANRLV
jgi:hypothetical protein